MQTDERKYSVFLAPAGDDLAYTEALVRAWCARFGMTPFEPHVTVYSVLLTDPEELKRAVTEAVRGVDPFSLHCRRVGAMEEYFKTLFIELDESVTLRKIHDGIKSRMGNDSGYRLFPHLSLLYRDMPLEEKRELARQVRLDREELLFDRIKVATPGNIREGWRDTGDWRTIHEVVLGKGGEL
ncbi:2'-5' RNA ligase family protein [Geobacter sp. DSM 9736]|uniref:2'-5' RNA ligase family protein n=1 Tax=Geobacter sp. DSM 9736 TaxID=1277350 RepID=UPI000B511E89|nr:2'-5' RNA ligase family protein [Geobacter sp. DSM 9736]SNB46723.1 2'-5' RNA ligase superfamily protein [Geobacter sp. DSM 9736]